MLQIILCILKIIGWILLVILGIIILAIAVLLFEPVCYQWNFHIQEKPKTIQTKLCFHWFFHLFRGQVLYENGEATFCMKIAWKTISFNDSNRDQQRNEKKEVEHVRCEESTVDPSSKREESFQQREQGEKEPIHKEEKKKNETQKENSNKIERIFEKIKFTFQKICATMRALQKKKDKIQRFLKSETHRKAWNLCCAQGKKLLRRVKPKKIAGSIEYGTDDPALTGQILALISMLYPFIGEQIEVIPDFDNKKFNVDTFVIGKIRSVYFLSMAIRLFFSKEIRITYKHISKLMNRM